MARTSARKTPRRSRRQESDAVEVLDALASRLAGMGSRKWKTQELAIALDKAAGTVEDVTVQEYIRGNLAQCAQQLHDRLLALQASAAEEAEQAEAVAPPAKRSKRVGKAKAAPRTAPGVELPAVAAAAAAAAPPATLNTAQGYEQLAAAAVAGQPDPRFTTASLLLARKPPSEQLVLAHVRQLQPESGSLDASLPLQGEALAAAAATALGTCAALSAESSDPADALRMFAPALGLLSDAWQLLSELEGPAAAFELRRLAARALASMHSSLLAHAIPHGVSNSSTTRCWRSYPPQQPAAAAAAEAACAAVCGLRASMQLHSAARGSAAVGRQRQQLEAQGAACAADIGLLAPHAASGVLSLLSSTPLEDVQGSSGAARRFLVLYLGAAQQELDGQRDYLSRVAAARTAAAAAQQLGEQGLAARLLEAASGVPASQEFVGWLHQQPPSGIVSAALAASKRGQDALSRHLVRECSERGLQALLAAMQQGAGGEGDEGAAAQDELLFFDDKAGDGSMFGRDWAVRSDGDEEEDDEDEGGGLERRLSVDLGGE
ncbi:hypothetical protein ACK3TF_001396 [Chlorella vulgaris]